MSRASKRAGFGNNRGAVNPKITFSATAPNNPKKWDFWVDTGTQILSYHNGSTWVNLLGSDEITSTAGSILGSNYFIVDPDNHSGLNWAYKSGKVSSGNVVNLVSGSTVLLTASSTNYVEIDPETGTVSANTTGFTRMNVPLYVVTTGVSSITNSNTRRSFMAGGEAHLQSMDILSTETAISNFAMDSAGNLYASNASAQLVKKWNTTTNAWDNYSSTLANDLTKICFDDNDDLYGIRSKTPFDYEWLYKYSGGSWSKIGDDYVNDNTTGSVSLEWDSVGDTVYAWLTNGSLYYWNGAAAWTELVNNNGLTLLKGLFYDSTAHALDATHVYEESTGSWNAVYTVSDGRTLRDMCVNDGKLYVSWENTSESGLLEYNGSTFTDVVKYPTTIHALVDLVSHKDTVYGLNDTGTQQNLYKYDVTYKKLVKMTNEGYYHAGGFRLFSNDEVIYITSNNFLAQWY